MPGTVVAERIIDIGTETLIEGPSTCTQYAVVFEDDGETGYFYGCDTEDEALIIDAMLIYDVIDVADKDAPSTVTIVWSEDGLKAGLFINRHPHAVFDFAARRGYCRSGFPLPGKEWAAVHNGHEWDDAAVELLR